MPCTRGKRNGRRDVCARQRGPGGRTAVRQPRGFVRPRDVPEPRGHRRWRRGAVPGRMVAVLRPGGWLAIDDFDLELIPRRVDATTAEGYLINKVTAAFHTLLASRGVAPAYGRTLPQAFDDAGLTDVHADGHV